MATLMFFAGPAIGILIGLALIAYPSRAAFYRRNHAGLEVFRSYGHSILTRWIEGGTKLLGLLIVVLCVFHVLNPTPPGRSPTMETKTGGR
ncbi:hypothetical protein FHS31_003032 [Sphingomonas vulcanisoli]|uniref:Molybdenum ABC transporter permease n=1 Tax=Sphingomonas vulcanisoli TaxID=1658060 RepID=A0ABX0U072_9SPHN|nr:hypothetical protein [Sphingomonas vulcanisoli]NIJ09400.1 hypothetical protein [Sphingomonas vulcanisoli]